MAKSKKWELERIKKCIDHGCDELDVFARRAAHHERMYELEYYSEEDEADAEAKGMTLKTTSLPKSVIVTADKMINYDPLITVPCNKAEEEEDSKARSRFLTHLWKEQHHIQEDNPLKYMAKTAFILGRAAGKVVWMGNDAAFPIKMWGLRPEDVFVKYGHKGKHWAFHRYELTVEDARDIYGDVFEGKEPHDIAEVTDFWYATYSKSGRASVYNAVIGCPISGDNEFLKEPKQEKYYNAIPIFMRHAEQEISKEPGRKGSGLLEGLDNAWASQNMVESLQATAAPLHYFPVITFKSSYGDKSDFVLRMGPGEINHISDEEELRTLNTDVNRLLADSITQRADDEIARLTFTPQLFGINQNSQPQSGFSVTALQQQTYGRMNDPIGCLESMVEHMNSLALCFAEKFFPPDGKEFWLRTEIDGYSDASISPSQIDATYQNHVAISITLDGSDISGRTLSMSEYREGLLSDTTYWERHKYARFSEDERTKIQMMTMHRDPDYIRAVVQEVMAATGREIPPYEPNLQDDTQVVQDAVNQVIQQQIAASAQPPPQQQVPQPPIDPALSGPLQGQVQPGQLGLPQQGAQQIFQPLVNDQELTLEDIQALEAGGQI